MAFLLILLPAPAGAQVDYRNLDDDRPTRVTDAFPIERFAFELSVPYRATFEGGKSDHAFSPHLEYGIARNLMVGVGADFALGGRIGEESQGSVSALWNPLRETPSLPGFGVTVSVRGPGFSRANLLVGALATRSFGRTRVHGNVVARLASPGATSGSESRWWAGLAIDQTLLRTSTLLVADLIAEETESGRTIGWIGEVGLRKQISPTLVFHAGVGQGLGGSARGTRLNLGLSHAFGVRRLMGRVS